MLHQPHAAEESLPFGHDDSGAGNSYRGQPSHISLSSEPSPWPHHSASLLPKHWCTMRFGSTAKVLLKCKLKYYRISECGDVYDLRARGYRALRPLTYTSTCASTHAHKIWVAGGRTLPDGSPWLRSPASCRHMAGTHPRFTSTSCPSAPWRGVTNVNLTQHPRAAFSQPLLACLGAAAGTVSHRQAVKRVFICIYQLQVRLDGAEIQHVRSCLAFHSSASRSSGDMGQFTGAMRAHPG